MCVCSDSVCEGVYVLVTFARVCVCDIVRQVTFVYEVAFVCELTVCVEGSVCSFF